MYISQRYMYIHGGKISINVCVLFECVNIPWSWRHWHRHLTPFLIFRWVVHSTFSVWLTGGGRSTWILDQSPAQTMIRGIFQIQHIVQVHRVHVSAGHNQFKLDDVSGTHVDRFCLYVPHFLRLVGFNETKKQQMMGFFHIYSK